MSQVQWITPQGNLASVSVNQPVTIPVLAFDPTNTGTFITYQVIGGSLPTGLSMSMLGVISGTPQYSSLTNNYFVSEQFNFIVRAVSRPVQRIYPDGIASTFTLTYSTTASDVVVQINNTTVSNYTINGNQITFTSVPAYDVPIAVAYTNQTDSIQLVDGNFGLLLTNQVNNDFYWVTQAGNLGTVPNGEFYQLPLEVVETIGNSTVNFSLISGDLPPGMQITNSGYLQGVPTLPDSITVDTSESFRFTIRASNSLGHVRDQSFSLTLTNVYGPSIQPSTGNVTILGTVFDGTFYSQQLKVTELNPNVSITWSNIGPLPPGVSISNAGLLSGFIQPAQLIGAFGPAGYDGEGSIGSIVTAGSIFIGGDYTIQTLGNTDFTSLGAVSNTVGLSFVATGIGNAQTTGTALYNSQNTTYQEEYDSAPYDFDELSQTLSYGFTIQAFDGANYDLQKYILNVVSRGDFTADNANLTVDTSSLTIDTEDNYIPVILNATETVLPSGRAGSYYAYQFLGYDFQGDAIQFSLSNQTGTFDATVITIDDGFDYQGTGTNDSPTEDPALTDVNRGGVGFDSFISGQSGTANLPGVTLDADTGWLYGRLNPQVAAFQDYTFGVLVSKTIANVVYSSVPVYFTLPVFGTVNNSIEWITPSNLGSINTGAVSDLAVQAKSINDEPLNYSLYDKANVAIRLPQGLELLSSGEISGRVSFETFSVDDYGLTFDGGLTTIDKDYTFNVIAQTEDGAVSSVQEFTLTVDVIDQEPYVNVYARAMPPVYQRQIWNGLVSNTEIFVPDLIYRSDDPWFGVQDNIDMLFVPGLRSADMDTFATAILDNNYTKTYQFGNVNTAVVLDESFNVKYEVVYVDILDPELNSSGDGPPLQLTLNNANPYIDASGNTFTTVYPNTSVDMTTRLVDGVGYYDQSSLPDWMTSNQLGVTASSFNVPLGYTRAVVLAYTVPGGSSLIAYRLNNSGINFNDISFTVDRYLLDNFYSTNFDSSSNVYISGTETTFDSFPNQNVGDIVASVDYAVSVPFDQINGRNISYINNAGGIDGVTTFENGDTLIFAQQENFLNPGPYEGWVDYIDAYIGDNIVTGVDVGYGAEPFDEYTTIPGYLEKAQGLASVNQRGGVWQVNIVNGIVNLVFVQEVQVNQRIRVMSGKTYSGAIMYYNQILSAGQTVPFYSVVKLQQGVVAHPTTFNGGTTRFFSYRDTYYTPNSNDKYLKFPQFGAFN